MRQDAESQDISKAVINIRSIFAMTIEGTPSPAHRPRTAVRGRGAKAYAVHYNDDRHASWMESCAIQAREAYGNRKPMDGALEVGMVFYLSKPKSSKNELPCVKPDLTNWAKATEDGCNGILWKDDSRIVKLTLEKRYAQGLEMLGVYVWVRKLKLEESK